jgi:adenosine deaminase
MNLHTHLEGRVRPTTAAELAAELGLVQPVMGWQRALELPGPSDLTVYLEKVASTYQLFAHPEALARIAREAVQDAAADDEAYLELRFGPATHVRDGFGLDAVIEAVCEGVAQGVRDTGTAAGVVVAALRHHDAATNNEVARAAGRYAGRGVVGFDLAGDELRYPDLEAYAEAFAIARAAGLGLTCHAAEAAPAAAALEAVTRFGVSRIGHGAHIVDDPEVLRRIADAGVAVEICPSSNFYTGAIAAISDHPAPLFRGAGVPVVLGDDNPRQTGSLLSAEERVLRDQLGFDTQALAALARHSVEFGFMADSVRRDLSARLTQTLTQSPTPRTP